jgi:5-methylcytosine-specific restriction endonuclease McrA
VRHGTQYGYRSGCRCDDCRAAKGAADATSYQRHRSKRRASAKAAYDADSEKYRDRVRSYYANNEDYREATKARAREWVLANPDRARARDKAWRKANKDRLRALARELYIAKRDERIAYSAVWAAANRERVREANRRWKRRNPEAVLAGVNRRRARKQTATVVPFTKTALDGRMSMFRGCWVCGGDASEIDHVKPLAAGGPHCLANLRPICSSCNLRKGARWPFDLTD